jgi:acetyltransferase-like isoleucine patch superfamily enzyme
VSVHPVTRVRHRVASDVIVTALRARGVGIDAGVRFLGRPIVSRARDSEIHIGADSRLVSRSDRTALGVNHAVVLRTLLPGAVLVLGRNLGMSGGSICAARRVTIGDGSLLGANVTVVDTDFHPLDSEERWSAGIPVPEEADEVVIGRNVFLGTGVIVLKGSVIGDNSVIGAGAVVSGTIPSGVIAAGNPARVLRFLEQTS